MAGPARRPVDWRSLRRAARRKLPRFLADYVDGGALDEGALARNRADAEAVRLLGRVLRAGGAAECATLLLGEAMAMPLAIAPTGFNDLIRPGGDIALARAAAAAGIAFMQSAASFTRIEQIVAATGRAPWFQLYVHDMAAAEAQLERVAAAGCTSLVVTVDLPVGGVRRRDDANRFGLDPSAAMVRQALLKPEWLLRTCKAQLGDPGRLRRLPPEIRARRLDLAFGWPEFSRLRARWSGRMWVKGLLHPGDAAEAVARGADGVIVSNHGGRQLDAAPSAWSVLPQVRAAVPDTPLILDGGVRTGEDIVRALALGASAAAIGRPALWALAAGGERLVVALLAQLEREFRTALQLLGCRSPAEVTPALIFRGDVSQSWDQKSSASA